MAGKGQQWDWEASLAVIYRGENKTKQKNRKWSQVLDLKTHFPWCAFFSKLHSRRFYKAHTALPADDKCLNARAYTRGDISFLNPNRMQDPCAPCEAGRNRQSSSREPPTWIHPFPSKSWPWRITWCAECRVQESDVDPEQLDVSLGTRAERFKVELKLYRWLRTWTQNCHWEWLWHRSLWTSQKYVTLNLHLWEDPKYVQWKKIKGLGTHSREQLWLPLWVGQGKSGQS